MPTAQEQRAAALAADGELTRAGIPPLPNAEFETDDANMAGGDNGQIAGVSQAHDVDSTASPYLLETAPASDSRSPDMHRNMSKPKPVTAEEAQDKATVSADYLDHPMTQPQRASYIAQMTEHLVGMPRAEFEQWKQDNLDPAWRR